MLGQAGAHAALSALAILLGLFGTSASAKILDGAYIVEFSPVETEGVAKAHFVSHMLSHHEEFHSHLQSRGVDYEIRREFKDAAIFSGVSIKVSNAAARAELYSAPNVKAIYPIRILPRPKVQHKSLVPSETGTHARKILANTTAYKILREAAAFASPPKTDSFRPHVMGGVSKLQDQGNYGKGIRVGVIDSGIDYTHPAFTNRCFGPDGCRVAYGYDFVGDDFDGTNEAVPDPDPNSKECSSLDAGHGTHVSGTIAANDTSLGFTGVAPRVTLGMYRVFGCEGGTPDDIITEAMMRGVADRSDVLSLSLGGPGWSQTASSVVASNIARQGRTVVVVAQGNAGDVGLFAASAPAAGLGVISVASVTNTEYTAFRATTLPNKINIPYFTPYPVTLIDDAQDLVFVGNGCTIDADLSNKITVAYYRAGCSVTNIFQNVQKKSGNKVILINPDNSPFYAVSGNDLNIALVRKTDGDALVAAIQSGAAKSLTFTPARQLNVGNKAFENTVDGGRISDFSSYGPTYYLDQANPGIAAPGENILSTFPTTLGYYAVIGGTSMATPFVSGAVAVYLAAKGNTKANKLAIAARLSNAGVPALPWDALSNSTVLDTVVQQGAGLLNLSRTFEATSLLTPPQLFLNDTTRSNRVQTVTISNNATGSVTYTFSHQAAGSALTLAKDLKTYNFPVPLATQYASVKFSTSKITVGAGKTARFNITFTAPTGLNASQFPVFSGYIRVKASNEAQAYSIPYFGLLGRNYDQQILYRDDDLIGHSLPALTNGEAYVEGDDWVDGAKTYTFGPGSRPVVNFWLQSGSPLIRIDLVNASADGLPANPIRKSKHKRQFAHHLAHRSFGVMPEISDATTMGNHLKARCADDENEIDFQTKMKLLAVTKPFKTLGTIESGTLDFVSRSYVDPENGLQSVAWDGYIVDSSGGLSEVPNGSYRLFLYAQKNAPGSGTKAKDHETWLSPIINIRRR